jgi:glucosamine-6-phosphate deaminase
MRVILEETYDEISNWVSLYIKYAINQHNNSNNNNNLTKEINKPFILGLPTGSTPLKLYKNLVKYKNTII